MSQNSYLLYGAGELGKNTLQKFLQNNLSVLAFIDQNISGKVCGITTDCLENIASLFYDQKESLTTIICLNAGTQHKDVAQRLFTFGFRKIVFLPIGYPLDYRTKTELTNLYNKALRAVDVASDVKDYFIYQGYHWKETAKVKNFESECICWLGEELLFSENQRDWKGERNNIHILNNMRDVNMNSLVQMHNLYLYLDGKINSCDIYLSFYPLLFRSQKAQEVLIDRKNLYLELNDNLRHGLDFFIEAAPSAIWNHHGYFNIVGGNHRTTFLQHKGWRFYPVKISAESYEYWLNKDALKDIISFISKHNITTTYVPIPHPCFMDFPSVEDKHGVTALSSILSFLGPIWLQGKKILDISQYEGVFARTAKRLRAEHIVCYNKSNILLEFSSKLANLLRISGIEFTSNERDISQHIDKFDIVFAMKNIELLLSYPSFQKFKGVLFVEFNPDDKMFIHNILSNTNLISYQKLYQKIVSGYPVEVGVFQG